MNNPVAINILSVPVHVVTMSETLALVSRYMTEPRLHQIATVNPEFVMTAQRDADFRRVLCSSDLCIPDGIGLLLAARRQGKALPERVPGSELIYHLAELAANEGWSLYLLGAAPGVAEEAAAVLAERYAGLNIAGVYAGSPFAADNDAIIQRINESGAALLFVAYGAPNQDKWIERNRDRMPTVRVAIGIGGSLDFITGRASRAPRWVQRLGLEWFHRLIKEPWRWRRMVALPRFAWQAILINKTIEGCQ